MAICAKCKMAVDERPTQLEFEGQDVFLFDPVYCKSCLLEVCQSFSVPCVNCGGLIPPFTQVGVLKADGGETQYVHMTLACSTVGSAFHGYLGLGSHGQFVQVEAC